MDALPPFFDSLAEYPRWFVVACATVAVAAGIWVSIKLLKVALYVLLAGVLVGGTMLVVWLLAN